MILSPYSEPIIKNDAIMIAITTNQTIANTTDPTLIEMDTEVVKVGTRLAVDAINYGIMVYTADVKTIEVTASLWVQRTTGAYSRMYIKKNTTLYAQQIFPAHAAGQDAWCNMNLSCIMDVEQWDAIQVFVNFSSSHASENTVNGGYDKSCIMTAKVLELVS